MIIQSRRSLLRGLFAMPAVVTASNLMPIKVFALESNLDPIQQIINDGLNYALFEPNDELTRKIVSDYVTLNLNHLVQKREIDDYIVVCDNSNNENGLVPLNLSVYANPTKSVWFKRYDAIYTSKKHIFGPEDENCVFGSKSPIYIGSNGNVGI